MPASRPSRLFVVVAVCCGVIVPAAVALPRPDEPIDPNKRASISTSDAVRPSTAPIQGNGVVPMRVVRMSEIPIRRASGVQDQRAAISVTEAREKKVLEPQKREMQVRKYERRRAAEMTASIPSIAPERFQRMIKEYEEGRVPASELLNADVSVDAQRVSIGDINRYANPRSALEAQGIPVRAAGSDAPAPSSSAPVPYSSAGNTSNPPPRASAPAEAQAPSRAR